MSSSSESETSSWEMFFDPSKVPLGLVTTAKADATRIEFTFEDWRVVSGVRLPFLVRIDDGERLFHYRFTDVRLNEGSLDDFKPQLEAR